MRDRLRAGSIAALALVMALAATASHPTPADTLRLNLTVGETLRFKSATTSLMDTEGMVAEMVVKAVSVVQVVERSGGWTKLRVTTEDLEIEGEGAAAAAVGDMVDGMEDVAYTFEVDETGRSRNIEIENADALDPAVRQMVSTGMRAQNAVGFMGVHFPKEPVEVGSSWDVEIDAEKMFDNEMFSDADGEIEFSYEVVGFEVLDGRRVVKISSEMSGDISLAVVTPGGDLEMFVTIEAEMTFWIDVATGTIVKMNSETTTETDFAFGSMVQTASTTLERVK